jgi:hypothetical protein
MAAMDGRAFLTEAHWRSAAGRAYYALLLEGREALARWGFALPPHHQLHAFARLRFSYAAVPDLKIIGDAVDRLGQLRNRADYDLNPSRWFASSARAHRALTDADAALALLDQIDVDSSRRSLAIAAIRAAWP